MVAGAACVESLQRCQCAFVADLAECPDGAVSLFEAVIFGVHVCNQCLDPVAWVLAHCCSANLLDARPDRKADAHERDEEKGKADQHSVTDRLLEIGKCAAAS